MAQVVEDMPKSFAVFEHQKRREWGLGVLAWEADNRRGYVFENGQVRVLAEPFYAMMREVDRPLDELQALFKCLQPELDAARAEQGTAFHTPKTTAATMSFEDQIAVFRDEYPGGFEDPTWLELQRGENAKKRVGAYREAAILDAKKRLSKRALKARVDAEEFQEMHNDICSVLRCTDLVPSSELAAFANVSAENQQVLALAVFELLHGKDLFGPRLDHFLTEFQQTVKKPAGWQLATTLPALLEPMDHVSIRPAAFRSQAKWMAPRLAVPKLPTAASYLRCLSMAKLILTKLGDRGESPRDLLDVLDFVRFTTRPAAKKRLLEIKRVAP